MQLVRLCIYSRFYIIPAFSLMYQTFHLLRRSSVALAEITLTSFTYCNYVSQYNKPAHQYTISWRTPRVSVSGPTWPIFRWGRAWRWATRLNLGAPLAYWINATKDNNARGTTLTLVILSLQIRNHYFVALRMFQPFQVAVRRSPYINHLFSRLTGRRGQHIRLLCDEPANLTACRWYNPIVHRTTCQ